MLAFQDYDFEKTGSDSYYQLNSRDELDQIHSKRPRTPHTPRKPRSRTTSMTHRESESQGSPTTSQDPRSLGQQSRDIPPQSPEQNPRIQGTPGTPCEYQQTPRSPRSLAQTTYRNLEQAQGQTPINCTRQYIGQRRRCITEKGPDPNIEFSEDWAPERNSDQNSESSVCLEFDMRPHPLPTAPPSYEEATQHQQQQQRRHHNQLLNQKQKRKRRKMGPGFFVGVHKSPGVDGTVSDDPSQWYQTL